MLIRQALKFINYSYLPVIIVVFDVSQLLRDRQDHRQKQNQQPRCLTHDVHIYPLFYVQKTRILFMCPQNTLFGVIIAGESGTPLTRKGFITHYLCAPC